MDYEIIPQTPVMPTHVHIGVAPGTGITWNVYPKDNESEDSLGKRVGEAHQGFARWVHEHEVKTVTVRCLTDYGVNYIEDHASCVGETGEMKPDYEAMECGKTFVKASHRLLEAVRDRLEPSVDDYGQVALEGVNHDSEQRQEFAAKAARNSVKVCIKRIECALAGKRQPKKVWL